MLSDKELEDLSDKVRRGEPIGFSEAIAVIDYQERLKADKKQKGFLSRLFRRKAVNGKESTK